jgi:hypothetical protein
MQDRFMFKRLTLVALLVAAPVLVAAVRTAGTTDDIRGAQGLTVHEWGTFTSVAGIDGMAVDWRPAGGPTDLPCFVALSDPSNLKSGPGPGTQLGGREGEGKIRMETPVLYFYSPQEATVNVRVSFPHGLITEYYPTVAKIGPSNLASAIQNLSSATGTIEWDNVRITPGASESFPLEAKRSHYYAARQTESNPVQVGDQKEKFLFYRGIASFQPPIAARLDASGAIEVTNLGNEKVPGVVLFENREGKFGFTIVRDLDKKTTIEHPVQTSDFASLQQSLEALLVAQGMYAAEARAMVATWRDTWFEKGTRVFYIVPSKTVDDTLPLSIDPKPAHVARAFVGRIEIITPEMQKEVLNAIRNDDRPVLESYGRFLSPTVNRVYAKLSEADWKRATDDIASIRAGYVADVTACSRNRRGW